LRARALLAALATRETGLGRQVVRSCFDPLIHWLNHFNTISSVRK
jgi:crotonobetainyl-CoA:carnitine CoA-transferase CaiB-like acyl-CoA transferase